MVVSLASCRATRIRLYSPSIAHSHPPSWSCWDKIAGYDRLRSAAYLSGTAGSSGNTYKSVVSALTNPIGAEQGFATRSGHHRRPLGGVYPISDSWQPLESGLNLKQVWMQPPDSCASPSAHPGRANGSSHPMLSRCRLPSLTSSADCCRSPIHPIPETWRPSHQGIARITAKSPPLRPTRDDVLVLLATLVALANLGICYLPVSSRHP